MYTYNFDNMSCTHNLEAIVSFYNVMSVNPESCFRYFKFNTNVHLSTRTAHINYFDSVLSIQLVAVIVFFLSH